MTATDGTSVDEVEVTWIASVGATGHRVYRDGSQVAEVTGTSFVDTGATAGAPPPAPGELVASQGTYTDRVELQWTAPTPAASSRSANSTGR